MVLESRFWLNSLR